MPFPSTHFLMVMSGPLYGAERWSCGLRLSRGAGFETEEVLETLAQDIGGAVSTWFAAQTVIGGAAKLDLVKMNPIGVDGKYLSSTKTYLREFATPINSPNAGTQAPQVALAATLETAAKRGLAARGRIYLPVPKDSLGADGRLTTANRDGARTQVINLVNALNLVRPGVRVVVASDQGAGAQREVTAVSVGRVYDTIRSRRTSLAEERVPAAVAAGT